MAPIRLTFDASLTKGTKRQKISMLRYWGTYCGTFNIDMEYFGTYPPNTSEEALEAICTDLMVLKGFVSFFFI